MIKKTYDKIEIGECFVLQYGQKDINIYMKIDHEKDHNYFSVAIKGKLKGRLIAPLEDDMIVISLDDILGETK